MLAAKMMSFASASHAARAPPLSDAMTDADGFSSLHSFIGTDSERTESCFRTRPPKIALRSGVSLIRLLPGCRAGSLPLTASGSHLIAAFLGDIAIDQGHSGSGAGLPLQALTVWRAGVENSTGELRHGPGAVAVVIHFPESWYRSCPRGPGCQIGEFLMRGGEPPVSQHQLDLDAGGAAVILKLLRASMDCDADLLPLERDVLALLSWAFGRYEAEIAAPATPEAVPSRHLARLRQARQILSRRQSDRPTVPELAQLVGLNDFDLKRYFKAYYGCGVAQYSRQQRLKAARNLLEFGSRSIAEVALDVGFRNPSQFARAFRRQFGINPAEHRRTGL